MNITIDVTLAQLQELVPENRRYFYTVVPSATQYMNQVVFVNESDFEDAIFHFYEDVLVTDFVEVYDNPITQVTSISN